MSVLGQPPDSVVVVPPLDRLPVAPPSGRDPLGLDQPAPGFVAPASALAPPPSTTAPEAEYPHEAPFDVAQEVERAIEPVDDRTPEPERAPEPVPGDGAELRGPMAMPPLHGDAGTPAVADHVALAGFAPLRPQPGYEVQSSADGGDMGALDESAAVALAPEVAQLPIEGEAAPPLDDARIAEAVDEIRMQVLQRIDIFTDTTLRAKLGEQLQPLVERASADLVAAINQHVGDLLRTYVAEALEQEIEHWRDSQR